MNFRGKSKFYFNLKNKYFCSKFGKNDVRCDLRYLEKMELSMKVFEYCSKQKNFNKSEFSPTGSTVRGLVAITYITSMFLMFTGDKNAIENIEIMHKYHVLDAVSEDEKFDKLCKKLSLTD